MPGSRSPTGAFAPNRHFFGEIKDVEFGPGQVESEVVRTSADQAVVRVLATGFNYFVRIPTPSLDVRFSDNYFDLRDGDLAEIAVRGLTEEVARRPAAGSLRFVLNDRRALMGLGDGPLISSIGTHHRDRWISQLHSAYDRAGLRWRCRSGR